MPVLPDPLLGAAPGAAVPVPVDVLGAFVSVELSLVLGDAAPPDVLSFFFASLSLTA